MWKVVKGTQVWSYEVWYCLKFKYNSVSKLPNTWAIERYWWKGSDKIELKIIDGKVNNDSYMGNNWIKSTKRSLCRNQTVEVVVSIITENKKVEYKRIWFLQMVSKPVLVIHISFFRLNNHHNYSTDKFMEKNGSQYSFG